jgi:hypothetical protein
MVIIESIGVNCANAFNQQGGNTNLITLHLNLQLQKHNLSFKVQVKSIAECGIQNVKKQGPRIQGSNRFIEWI